MPGANFGPRLFMNTQKLTIIILIVLCAGYFISLPCLVLQSDDGLLIRLPANRDNGITLKYTHSVHKTLVVENISIDNSGKLVVNSTEYESYGVGLPYLADEGKFRQEGTRFILEDINRPFSIINLRAGPEAKLEMYYQGKVYALYQMVPSGGLISLRVAPYYSTWL
ncbi:DUF1850 domain-containing protein [Dendrosporobacter sp. 1207_IL3150]|uniref:DUF1850 domain-containing protein n=1 Tax=Dendrosporobacter sp. 1207_IL3150 TaxID=3084054 RepID=UPI002FD98985